MANFNGYGQAAEVVLSSFGGLNRTGPLCGAGHCFELRNLRPMADGTLVRREGYKPLISMDAQVRGVFYIERNGLPEAYAAAGDAVYYLEVKDGQCTPHLLGKLGNDQGEVRFFCYDRKLLMLDGREIWELTPDQLCTMQAYIPLYGNGWNNMDNGARTVYEPPNNLSDKLRIRFCLASQTHNYEFGEIPVSSVDCVWVNGKIYEGIQTYDADTRTMHLNNAVNAGAIVETLVTVEEDFCGGRALIAGAKHVASIGHAEDERLLFYGGSVMSGSVCMSRKVESAERELVCKINSDICMLYVSEQDALTLGDGLHAVTGACRHYDRSLIFTENATWMADGTISESGKLLLIPINTTLGCSSEGACGVVGNEPITLMNGRVLRWNSKTDERNECNAEVISHAIEPLLSQGADKNIALFVDVRRGDVWFYTPGKSGRILIRDEQNECWTSFDGFTPQGIFAFGDRVGFYEGQAVFVFDADEYCDTAADGEQHGIKAELLTGFLDFGHTGRVKRVVGATVSASCGRQRTQLVLRHVSGRERMISMQGNGDELSVMQARADSGRFRYLRIGLRCSDVGPWHLHGVRLAVR